MPQKCGICQMTACTIREQCSCLASLQLQSSHISVTDKTEEKTMRLRHIRGAEEAIETSPFVIQNPKEHRGHFCDLFGNTNPIQIEVGMERESSSWSWPRNIRRRISSALSVTPACCCGRFRSGKSLRFPIYISCVWTRKSWGDLCAGRGREDLLKLF